MSSKIETLEQLDQVMTRPSQRLVEFMGHLNGDLMILGAGGKMGPSLAIRARKALQQAGRTAKVIAVSRFSDAAVVKALHQHGVETIVCDLLDEQQWQHLPEAENIIYMVGKKFGATGNEAETWAVNAYLPALVCRRFQHSRILLFSTANVYPFVPVSSGGCTEEHPVGPVGEYAQSALGRERIFSFFCQTLNIPGVIIRLSYAIDLRYGVLLDIGQRVWQEQPVPLAMGYCHVIWQGDACDMALRSLDLADTPPAVLNLTGPELVAVRAVAEAFGKLLHKKPLFHGVEADTALLCHAGLAHKLFGYPQISLQQMIEWTAHWIKIGGPTLNKPTHFEVRDGRF